MNSYYVEYFKEMRGVQSEDLGAAVRPGTVIFSGSEDSLETTLRAS